MVKRTDLRVHLPEWITKMFPSAIWRMPTGHPTVYLTFDDGPIPEVTPLVLEILRKYNIKATFFCVGDNVYKYPQVYKQVLEDGHSVGNHTFNHIQGLKCGTKKYLQNIEDAAKYIDSDLFRPPHGIMRRLQYGIVKQKYHIVLWDVISCDYDPQLKPEQCLKNVIDFVQDGSIITFHDSIKAKENVLYALPKAIEYLLEKGYDFKKIELPRKKPLKIKVAAEQQFKAMKENINRLLKGA